MYSKYFFTFGVIKTVPSVYTLLMDTIYLSHSTQVAEGTVFRKHTVPGGFHMMVLFAFLDFLGRKFWDYLFNFKGLIFK